MRFWFSDEGSSETQTCRLARAIAFRTNDTQNLPFGPTLPWGGGGVPVSMQRTKIFFLDVPDLGLICLQRLSADDTQWANFDLRKKNLGPLH